MKNRGILGVILILIGVAWIIKQTGVVSINWAASIKTLWPIFLVSTGATVMLSNKKRLVTGIWILTFALLVGFGIYKRDESNRIFELKKSFEIDLGPATHVEKQRVENEILLEPGTEEGRLILQLGAVKTQLSAGNNDMLVQLDSNIPNLEQRLSQGKQVVLEYSHEQVNRKTIPNFNLQMNPTLLWDINANMGIVDGRLDLGKVPLQGIELNLAAGSLELIVGEQQPSTNIRLRTGVANLDLYIPEDAGLKVKSGKFLSDLSFHNITVTEKDGEFITENYEKADQKIEIDIVTAMSAIRIFGK